MNQPSTERRRSERLSESLPLIVRGIDLLGQPFEERTSTLAFNLHGCRYTSKHHLPRNTWVTLDPSYRGRSRSVSCGRSGSGAGNAGTSTGADPAGNSRTTLRARVAWVQRPHSIRDFRSVELESPANIWGTGAAEWNSAPAASLESANPPARSIPRFSERPETNATAGDIGNSMDHSKTEVKFDSREIHVVAAPAAAHEPGQEAMLQAAAAPAADSPLLRELRAELDRQAKDAVLAAAEQAREEVLQTAAASARARTAALKNFSRSGRARSKSYKPARARIFRASVCEAG